MQARSGTSILYGRCILHGFLVNKIFRFPVQMLCDMTKTRGALTFNIFCSRPGSVGTLLVLPQSLYTTQSHSVRRGAFFLKESLYLVSSN